VPQGNHKGKFCRNYTKEHNKGVKAYWYQKASKHKNDSKKKTRNNGSIKTTTTTTK